MYDSSENESNKHELPTREEGRSGELSFDYYGRTIAAQEWGQLGDKPVLALHGWLDNSASFANLAPLLKNVHLVALDLAGHGLSSYREPGGPYNIWQDVGEIFEVANQLGWQEFSLLGHSRGAMISVVAAGTFPERIQQLALIDGFRPGTVAADQAPQQLAKSIIDTQRINQRGIGYYPDRESAIRVRQRAEIPISYAMAELLASRGVREEADGFVWQSDQQLKIASAMKLSEAQAHAFIQRITAPTTLIIAEDGMPRLREYNQSMAARYPHIQCHHLAGGHHLHMEDNVQGVADVLNHFFA
jgi:pimeloyl-ACP methyl ester carboxylesterase